VRTLFTVIVLDIKYEPVDYYVVLLFYGFSPDRNVLE
jgi:hypothetical protein